MKIKTQDNYHPQPFQNVVLKKKNKIHDFLNIKNNKTKKKKKIHDKSKRWETTNHKSPSHSRTPQQRKNTLKCLGKTCGFNNDKEIMK